MASTTIASVELLRRRSDEVELHVIDVRTGAEFESAHIPGSHNVPLDILNQNARAFSTVDSPVVLVCQSGQRAATAQKALGELGKNPTTVLDGGINAWQASGGDIVHGSTTRWAMDRQVRLVAGSLALGGILASVAVPKAKWLSGGIGAGLTFSALTNTCTMGDMLGKLPYNNPCECDIDAVLAELNNRTDAPAIN